MSIVTLQVGQCGNQLGQVFFDTLHGEIGANFGDNLAGSTFFKQDSNGRHIARSLLIDMEPKVVSSCLMQRGRLWSYSKGSAVVQQSGSGTPCPSTRTHMQFAARCTALQVSAGTKMIEQCTLATLMHPGLLCIWRLASAAMCRQQLGAWLPWCPLRYSCHRQSQTRSGSL